MERGGRSVSSRRKTAVGPAQDPPVPPAEPGQRGGGARVSWQRFSVGGAAPPRPACGSAALAAREASVNRRVLFPGVRACHPPTAGRGAFLGGPKARVRAGGVCGCAVTRRKAAGSSAPAGAGWTLASVDRWFRGDELLPGADGSGPQGRGRGWGPVSVRCGMRGAR